MPKKKFAGVVLLAALFIVCGAGKLYSTTGIFRYRQPRIFTEASFMRTFSSPKMSEDEREDFLNSEHGQNLLRLLNRLIESRLIDRQVFFYYTLVQLLLGSMLIAMGIGLINLKEWARIFTVYYHLLVMPLALLVADMYIYKIWQVVKSVFALGESESFVVGALAVKTCLGVVIAFLIAFFFSRDKIKDQFEPGQTTGEQVPSEERQIV